MAQHFTAKSTVLRETQASPTPKSRKTSASSATLVKTFVNALQTKKGTHISVINMRNVSGITDYFVLCTGTSDQQIKALADAVRVDAKEKHAELPWHIEGYEARRWVVMDYVDVVVHILDAERRAFYDLERLWADAPIEHVADDASSISLLEDAPS